MLTFLKPIALIMLASSSSLERQKLRTAARREEYVFVEATSIYQCLDITESHHPQCVVLDFSLIQNNYLQVFEFIQFLNIPIILFVEHPPAHLLKYFIEQTKMSIIKKPLNELELHRSLEAALYSEDCKEFDKRKYACELTFKTSKNNQTTNLEAIINSAVKEAITRLSELVESKITFENPMIEALPRLLVQKKLEEMLGNQLICISQISFTGNLSGTAQILLSQAAAETIALSLSEGLFNENEVAVIKADILSEISNIVINAVVGTLSNAFKYRVHYINPTYTEGYIYQIFDSMHLDSNSTIIMSNSHFKIDQLAVEGDFFLFFKARLILDLLFS
ncbi:MAG: hypothetical protein F6K41_30195 [Symploca sp. SIO3E6]|nr:hypothetical protein [Caldora sp. SIO3E6]